MKTGLVLLMVGISTALGASSSFAGGGPSGLFFYCKNVENRMFFQINGYGLRGLQEGAVLFFGWESADEGQFGPTAQYEISEVRSTSLGDRVVLRHYSWKDFGPVELQFMGNTSEVNVQVTVSEKVYPATHFSCRQQDWTE